MGEDLRQRTAVTTWLFLGHYVCIGQPHLTGTVKNFNTERGFGWLNCADTTARFGREVYLSKEAGPQRLPLSLDL